MFILGNLLIALAQVLDVALTCLYWFILIRALLSWVSPDPFNPLVQFLYKVTDPILNPIRARLPALSIDISPLIAFLIIVFMQKFLVGTLFDAGFHFKSM